MTFPLPDPADWSGRSVCVAGARVVGLAVGEVLARRGAAVTVVDAADDEATRARGATLERFGAAVRLGDGDTLPQRTDLLVVSPGFAPSAPIVRAAQARAVPVWGDVELAWRLRPAAAAPWLCVTGTNGKTTTVRMLEAILTAGGHRAIAAGNIGLPLLDAVLAEEPYDVLAVELSSFQLHYTASARPLAAAVLNVAPDHLDWHGGLAAYAAAKGRVYTGAQRACVYNAADPVTLDLARAAAVAPGCRPVGCTLDPPPAGMLGVRAGRLVDRAFAEASVGEVGTDLAAVSDVAPAAPHNVENALAAAALARAYGVTPGAVREGLRAFRPEAHRIALVATVGGVGYVDDSKATNPHAAAASLRAYPSVVWVAGGLAKGAAFDDLVSGARDRLRAVVLLGRDRGVIADALARHAPDVPVVDVTVTDTGDVDVMDRVVEAAGSLARAGDTVLLAPGCASMDLFRDYAARGDAFAAAVTRWSATSAASPQPASR